MSDREAEDGQNTRLLRALVWAGVGMAPVAALVVLLGGGEGPIRFGVLLIAVCVVLLGASLLIRNDPVLLRMDIEDRVAAEVDALRSELRIEFATAAARAAAAPTPTAARVAPTPSPARAVPAPPGLGSSSRHVPAPRGPGAAAPRPVHAQPVPGVAMRPVPAQPVPGVAERPVPAQPGPGLAARPAPAAPGPGVARPRNTQIRAVTGPVRAAAPAREPGHSTGGRAVVPQPVPQPAPVYHPDSDYAYPPEDYPLERGEAGEPEYPLEVDYPPEATHEERPVYPLEANYSPDAAHPERRVASAPGWPDSRPTSSGRAVASASAAPVSRGPVGGHPVLRQRGRGAASVPPPPAPVSNPPHRNDDQGGRRRADVTAVDLGYTGRRKRSSHSADDFDPVSEIDEPHTGDPLADQHEDWSGWENTSGRENTGW